MAQNQEVGGFPSLARNASELPYSVGYKGLVLAGQLYLCAVLALGPVLIIWLQVTHPGAPTGSMAVLDVVAVALLAGCLYRLWQLRSPWLVLYPDRLEKRELTGWRIFNRADMDGLRTGADRSGKWFVIIPKPDRPGLRAARFAQSVRNDPVIDQWLSGLCDFTAQETAAATAEVLADPRFGADPATRQTRLKLAVRVVTVFTYACLAIAGWLALFSPFDLLSLAAAIVPMVLAVAAVLASNGLVAWLDMSRVRPSVSAAFLPGAALVFATFSRIHLLNASRLLWLAAAFGLGMAVLAYSRLAGARNWGALVGVALVTGAFAYGVAADIDVALDKSKVQLYPQIVSSKHRTSGRSTTYYINVGPWADQRAGRVSVPASVYYQLIVGSDVCFFRQSGAVGVNWFRVDLCPAGTFIPASLAVANAPQS